MLTFAAWLRHERRTWLSCRRRRLPGLFFDTVAATYDRARPRYPEELIDLAATVAGARARRANISEAWSWLGSHRLACAEAARLFGNAEVAATPMLLEHTPAEIIGLMSSASYYQRLSEKQRLVLEAAVAALYEQRGRKIRSSTVAVLVCARHA